MAKFVAYINVHDSSEVLICNLEDENKLLSEYFSKDSERKINDYDRDEVNGPVIVVIPRNSVR